MAKDKFSATWTSHSSISDYLKCPRSYFLKNVYKNPKTGRKISLTSPALALGQSVHSVLESLAQVPTAERSLGDLGARFEVAWEKVSGKKGGFTSKTQEDETKERGLRMLRRVKENAGPLLRPTIKIRQELPYFWLSEDDNIILCGKLDWIEYLPDTDSVTIYDFKTGKYDEDPDSLQLPIYLLLATRCQTKPVSGACYWYLDRDDAPKPVVMPDEDKAFSTILPIAKKIALARKLEHFNCSKVSGCRFCSPLETVIKGQAEYIGLSDYGQEVYLL